MLKTFIPTDIQCFWCNGQAKRGTHLDADTDLDHVTYFCENCGGVSHFAVSKKYKITSINTKYKTNGEQK